VRPTVTVAEFTNSDFGQHESAGIVEQRCLIALVSRVPCLRNFLSLAHVVGLTHAALIRAYMQRN